MVDDRAIEGQNISIGNDCSVDIVIAGLRKWERGSPGQNTCPDERRPEAHISKKIRDHRNHLPIIAERRVILNRSISSGALAAKTTLFPWYLWGGLRILRVIDLIVLSSNRR
jgi:hypothetical protein